MLPSGTKCNETRSQGTSPASSKRRMRSDVELLTKRLQEANEQATVDPLYQHMHKQEVKHRDAVAL